MINVSVSYGFGGSNRYNLDNIPTDIQLALHKYEKFYKYRDDIYRAVEENNIKVRVTHLPLDVLRGTPNEMMLMIKEISEKTMCRKFVIHPNKNIKSFVASYIIAGMLHNELCIETFGWGSNKVLRSPLEIAEYILLRRQPNLKMVIDTSHIEEMWFDPKIMSFLLRHTSIIHLSNRAKGIGDHLPFTSPDGDLNLVRFANDLKYKYKWSGDIVLEYKEDHKHKLYKNAKYLRSLVN